MEIKRIVRKRLMRISVLGEDGEFFTQTKK
jgi:hypothetical protein